MKDRLDAILHARGLATSRAQAQALVLAGQVAVAGAVVTKAGTRIADDAEIVVTALPRYVSRGGDKLETALRGFAWDVTGALALDLGASTGGFSDCLLQHGAARVAAVDVGYGQLHPRIRGDDRVTVLERLNARALVAAALPFTPDLLVADVSFISLTLVLESAIATLARPWRALVLVKPQFEAGRDQVDRGGVIRDPTLRAAAIERVARYAGGLGAVAIGALDTGHPGPAGNHEYLLALASADHTAADDGHRRDPSDIARDAVSAA